MSSGTVDVAIDVDGVDITKEQMFTFQKSAHSLESIRCRVRIDVSTRRIMFSWRMIIWQFYMLVAVS